MFVPKTWALAFLAITGLAEAQPALTTIQDILYRADGSRFNGTMFITWSAFQAGDTSNIATANVTLPIVNGVLSVALVPTTTASAGAQYNVTYNQNGVNQFTQVWAVPPSSVNLRIRDVLVSTGTVVGGGVYPGFSDSEIPFGTINGTNTAFTLAFAPSPAASLELYLNGLRLDAGVDFTLSSRTITFTGSVPQTGDLLLGSYRYANPSNPLGSLTTPQVVCSSTGSSTIVSTLTQLGSCTLPAGLLGAGDRLEIEYHYMHTGGTAGFTGEVQIAGTVVVVNRSGALTESIFAGHTSFGLYSGGQTWDTESWGGSTLAFASSAGNSAIDPTVATTISFQGLVSSSADVLTLRNFTVIRYPSQTNP